MTPKNIFEFPSHARVLAASPTPADAESRADAHTHSHTHHRANTMPNDTVVKANLLPADPIRSLSHSRRRINRDGRRREGKAKNQE